MKIGIVGIGGVAVGNYLPLLGQREDVSLALYNRTPAKAEEAAGRFGGVALSSIAELVAWRPDTVLVLTNETTRYEVAGELLRAKVPRMFCEKPLVARKGQAAVSEEDFLHGCELLRQAGATGCEVAMMFNYRFFDQTLAARRIMEERGFGRVTHVVAQVHYACWSHCIDLIRQFAGDIEEVSALGGREEREGQGIVARDLAAALSMESGATGILLGTSGMQWQHPLYELHVTCERGRLHLRDIDGELEVLDGAGKLHERISIGRDTSRWDHYGASFGKALAAYLDSVKQGAPPPVTGLDGLKELQVEAALRRSIAQRRPVRLSTEFPLP